MFKPNQVVFAFGLACLPAFIACAQYRDNPLIGQHWLTVSGGLNTADYVSWQTGVSYAFRGESLVTQMRLMYSQELIEGPADSCFAFKNRIAEYGLMWGDGWGGKHWYVSGGIGMGLNIRMFCDRKVQDRNSFRYRTAATIGVPVQAECGVWLGPSFGLNLTALANWNFRQPYVGGHLGLIWRLRQGTGAP